MLSPSPMPSPTSLVVKNGSKILSTCFGVNARAIVPDRQDGLTVFNPAVDPDGRLFTVGEGLRLQRVEGILQDVHQHLDQLVFVGPDRLAFRELLLDLHRVPPFVAEEPQRGRDDLGHGHRVQLLGVGMREHAQIGNDGLHPLEPLLHVGEDLGIFALLFRGEVFALFAQREKPRRGEVQRVVDLVDDARAHAAERRQLFGLHQLHLVFLELLEARFQRLAALIQFAAGDKLADAGPGCESRFPL